MTAPPFPHRAAFDTMRNFALSLPETTEDFPWAESAFKVKGKVFVFTRNDAAGLHLSCKLPQSREFALEYPFTQPTGYGLGKSGWVTANFAPEDTPPVDILKARVGESYRAVAPKKLAAQFATG